MKLKLIDKTIYCDGVPVAELTDGLSCQERYAFKDLLVNITNSIDAECISTQDEYDDLTSKCSDLEDEVSSLEDKVEDMEIELSDFKDSVQEDLAEYFYVLENKSKETDPVKISEAIIKQTNKIKRIYL